MRWVHEALMWHDLSVSLVHLLFFFGLDKMNQTTGIKKAKTTQFSLMLGYDWLRFW